MPTIEAKDYPYSKLAKAIKTDQRDLNCYYLIKLADDWNAQKEVIKSNDQFLAYLRHILINYDHKDDKDRDQQIIKGMKQMDKLHVIDFMTKPTMHIRLGESGIGFFIRRVDKYNQTDQSRNIVMFGAGALLALVLTLYLFCIGSLMFGAAMAVLTFLAGFDAVIDYLQIKTSKRACLALLHLRISKHNYLRRIYTYKNADTKGGKLYELKKKRLKRKAERKKESAESKAKAKKSS